MCLINYYNVTREINLSANTYYAPNITAMVSNFIIRLHLILYTYLMIFLLNKIVVE